MAKFFDANYKITKISTINGDISELQINNKDVDLSYNGLPLYCWKHSSSYIYTKTIPTGNGTIGVITESPLAKANGTYAGETTTDIWKIGSTFYEANLSGGTEPDGDSGTPVDIGDVYIATALDTDLDEGTWYTKSDSKWYEVSGLTKTKLTLGEEVTDEDAITALEAVTTSEVDYVLYTYEEHITVSNTDYFRYDTKDITL